MQDRTLHAPASPRSRRRHRRRRSLHPPGSGHHLDGDVDRIAGRCGAGVVGRDRGQRIRPCLRAWPVDRVRRQRASAHGVGADEELDEGDRHRRSPRRFGCQRDVAGRWHRALGRAGQRHGRHAHEPVAHHARHHGVSAVVGVHTVREVAGLAHGRRVEVDGRQAHVGGDLVDDRDDLIVDDRAADGEGVGQRVERQRQIHHRLRRHRREVVDQRRQIDRELRRARAGVAAVPVVGLGVIGAEHDDHVDHRAVARAGHEAGRVGVLQRLRVGRVPGRQQRRAGVPEVAHGDAAAQQSLKLARVVVGGVAGADARGDAVAHAGHVRGHAGLRARGGRAGEQKRAGGQGAPDGTQGDVALRLSARHRRAA